MSALPPNDRKPPSRAAFYTLTTLNWFFIILLSLIIGVSLAVGHISDAIVMAAFVFLLTAQNTRLRTRYRKGQNED